METAKKFILGAGTHIVRIKSAKITYSNLGLESDDRTPQLELLFVNEKGFIRKWYNLVGYKRFWELTEEEMDSGQFKKSFIGDYALKICRSGALELRKRVFCKERTKKCLKIIRNLAEELGIKNEDFCFRDFVGKEAEIEVFEKDERFIVEVVKKLKLQKKLEVAKFEQLLPMITNYYRQQEDLL